MTMKLIFAALLFSMMVYTATPAPDEMTGNLQTCIVSADRLNLRTQPGASAAVIGVLHGGQGLTLTGWDVFSLTSAEVWREVMTREQTGWVNGRYCE